MTRIFLFLSGVLFCFSNGVNISGHLIDDRNIYPSQIANRQLILTAGTKIIAKTKTDSRGYYELYFLDTLSKNTVFNFYLTENLERDTLLLKSLSRFESDTPVIDLFILRKMKSKRSK